MNDSMCVDDQKVSGTLEEQQKTTVIKTSGSELDIIESNDDNIFNDFAYSIDEDEDEEVFKQSEIDSEELKNDNFDSEIINHVENHNNDNKKINNNYNNNKNYSNMCTSSPINLSDKITSTTDGVRINVIDDESDDCDESTNSNRQLYSVKASTSLEAVQQRSFYLPGSECTSTMSNYRSDDKTLDSTLQNDSYQYQTSKSENTWIPTTCVHKDNTTDESQTQVIYEKVRDILNELTLENVDKLTQQFEDLNINSHERLQGVVDLIFDKAIDEPDFAAKLKHIFEIYYSHVVEMSAINKVERDAKLKEIEECNDIKKKQKLTALLNDADCRLGRKAVGNSKLIGELYNREMLRVAFIHKCIKHLLRTPVDYNIECLCMLLTTTGAKLENSKENNFSWYFGKMHRLAKDKTGPKKLSSRLRFMLYDVINLKARKWEPIKYKDNTMKQPYAVATSTSMETNQQTSIQLPGCTSAKKNYRSDEKSLDSQNDSQQLENSGKPIIRWQISTIGDSQTQSLHEKVQSILNKLTLENVDKLAKQVKSLDINSHEKLQCVVDVVFEKTINEPNFVTVSAIMLARCEHEFESVSVDKVARDAKLKEIKECDDIKKKTKLIDLLIDADCRAVGNIRLIGELFNHTMLTVVFIKTCINHLLTILDENNIECLCELLKTIGATRESLKNNIFNDYFSQMTELAQSDNDKISSRVRFMLQNVIDLRAQNSKPKRVEGNPITINQM
ncbi:von Willebrand factor A domain-containing protein DDB_G0286969-like [Aphidius gifuensis]|uniref:von Willebrand factor A domain-containing protein DDB_G0286969-like n=1 Tax=Aphidius gifuensis TaxID=684658 RepID=UPI001CDCD493|nr:von Willebrand factor A domain-containing protein DDB_G0286969-like [Aphidius gifuensis]